MNAQTKPITTWRELCNMFVEAMEWSDPATAEPIGTAEFERHGGIVRVTITVDLVPRGTQNVLPIIST
jgi:hypothetical protein